MGVPLKLRPIPLWVEKWNEAALRARHAQEPRSFERGFRLRAYADGEHTFPSFLQCRAHGYSLGDVQRSNWPKFFGLDLSSKKRPGNAIVVVAVHPSTKRRYVCDVRFGAWKSNETCEALADLNRTYRPVVIMVENNGYQESLIEWAQASKGNNDYWMKLEPTTTTDGNKMNADLGLPSLQVEFHNKAWLFPYDEYEGAFPDDTGQRGQWARLDYEFRNYPLAKTSDGVMACVAPGALVTTLRGLVPIEGVRIGDHVLTHRSRWREVLGAYVREYDGEACRIRTAHTLPFIVTSDHAIWSAKPCFLRDGTNRLYPSWKTWAFREAAKLRVGRKLEGDYVFEPVPQGWLPEPSPDPDFAFLCGLYLARGRTSHHQAGFSIGAKQNALHAFVRRVVKGAFGRECGVQSRNGGEYIYFGGDAVALWRRFGSGTGRAMPWSWMGWPASSLEQVARGWFVGNGHMVDGRIQGVSVSRSLLYQVSFALKRRGLIPSITLFERGGARLICGRMAVVRPSWRLSLNESDTARWFVGAGELERERWGNVSTRHREKTNAQSVAVSGGHALRIRENEALQYAGPVHNIHVDEDESFVVEGVAVHNCWFARQGIEIYGGGGYDIGEGDLSGIGKR